MAKFAQRTTIFSFFACLLLLTALTPAFGRGNQDADLALADQLINDREYDEATLILSEYIRRFPDRFELAHQRLQRINQIREEFNRVADELIFMLLNDPENSERILLLTTRLRSLERENSELMRNFVTRTHEIAQFNVLRNQLRNILERGREMLDRGDIEGALQMYASGMGLMREDFFTAGFGARIEREVQQETERLNSILASLGPENTRMTSISAELTRAINSGQPARIQDQINNLSPVMDNFIGMKQGIYDSVNITDRILDELRSAHPGMGDRNHLAFLTRLINGRPNEQIQEGLLGVFDASWRASIGSVINVIVSNMENIYSSSLRAFNAGNYAVVATSLGDIESYVNYSPIFFEKHRQLNEGRNPQTVLLLGNLILEEDLHTFVRIMSLSEAGKILLQAANIAVHREIDRSALTRWQEGSMNTAEALNRERQTRNNIINMQREIAEMINNANLASSEISTHYSATHIRDSLNAIQTLHSGIFTEERLSVHRYYSIEHLDLERNLASRRNELERGRGLLEGQRQTVDGEERIFRYPAEALESFTAMLSAVSANLEHANSVLAQFRNEPQAISTNAEITNLRNAYQVTINELNNLRTQGIALSETARSRTALAESHRQDGARLFNQAQAAYQRQDYEAARLSIQQASERFNSSLEIQESASLRETWDNQVVALGRAIAIAENERIIAEVRTMVNTARNAFFSGDFQLAENNLTRARDRWLITNTEENEEVLYWLGMVRGGTSARADRIIPVTAPLFPEMSQLLSQAQRNFDEGVRFINAGQRTQGIEKFDEARLLTREVKLVFPVNQEAGILELRMEQFMDPSAFNASFEQRLRTAITGTRQRSIEAYADLQNLAEINPRYPGIRGILDQAEVDMGFRPPPPNPANLARSRELTASASRILDGNITAQFEVALAQINEAITLNPENAEATRVKDRLMSRMNVPGTIVLSSEDEEQYQRAVRELQAGNNLVALALVDRLLQNPRNRNITKLIELQRRIQAVL
jgi:tetratricopeptide (TPR) repeat protein